MFRSFSRHSKRENVVHEHLVRFAPFPILEKNHSLSDFRRFVKNALPLTVSGEVLRVDLHIDSDAIRAELLVYVLSVTGGHLGSLDLDRADMVVLDRVDYERLRHVLPTREIQ